MSVIECLSKGLRGSLTETLNMHKLFCKGTFSCSRTIPISPRSSLCNRLSNSAYPYEGILTSANFTLQDSKAWKAFAHELVDFCRYYSTAVPLVTMGLERSSVDNSQQDLSSALEPDYGFWSSSGSLQREANEYILVKLVSPDCIISKVEIDFYQALYQQGKPTYASSKIKVSIGMSKDNFHYVSDSIVVENTPHRQIIQISPNVVFGEYMRIDFLGKRQTQPGDMKLYTCVRYVTAWGLTLGMIPELRHKGKRFLRVHRQLSNIYDDIRHTC